MYDHKRSPRYGNKRGFGSAPRRDREMHSASCATCGAPVQVPFKPNGSRPIYCREHLSNLTFMSGRTPNPARPIPKREYLRRDFRPSAPVAAPVRPAAPDHRLDTLISQVTQLTAKVDKILYEIELATAPEPEPAPKVPAKKKAAKAKK